MTTWKQTRIWIIPFLFLPQFFIPLVGWSKPLCSHIAYIYMDPFLRPSIHKSRSLCSVGDIRSSRSLHPPSTFRDPVLLSNSRCLLFYKRVCVPVYLFILYVGFLAMCWLGLGCHWHGQSSLPVWNLMDRPVHPASCTRGKIYLHFR